MSRGQNSIRERESVMVILIIILYCTVYSVTFMQFFLSVFNFDKTHINMPRLPHNCRDEAIGVLEAGVSVRAVARHFNSTKATIYCLQQRNNATGITKDRPRSGRLRVITPNQDRRIRMLHLRDRFYRATTTATETPGRTNNRISPNMVIRRLREHGLRPRRPYVGMVMKERRRRRRRAWENNHRRGD